MSLESSIAALTTQAGLLLDLPQTIANTANAKIVEINAAHQAVIATSAVTYYVNQATGNNAAAGTAAAPLATINEALRRVPAGGVCTVELVGNYQVNETIYVDRRTLNIISGAAVRPMLSFARHSIVGGATIYRGLRSFTPRFGSQINFRNIAFAVPSVDGEMAAWLTSPHGAIVRFEWHDTTPFFDVSFTSCRFDFGASIYGKIIGIAVGRLSAVDITVTGGSIAGNWVVGADAAGGTTISGLPWLISNLTAV